MTIYELCGDRVTICGSACHRLRRGADPATPSTWTMGVVETIAHYTAAKYFQPDVDFILDIGGQDIKCFKIRNGAIDSHYAQRGLLLRLRLLYRNLCQGHGLSHGGICPAGAVSPRLR